MAIVTEVENGGKNWNVTTAAEPLHGTEGDELADVLSHAVQQRAEEEVAMASWKIRRRSYKSESLPHSGVDAVEASRYAVTAQDSLLSPPSSLVMRGSAGGDDALVQGVEEHPRDQAAEHHENLPVAEITLVAGTSG